LLVGLHLLRHRLLVLVLLVFMLQSSVGHHNVRGTSLRLALLHHCVPVLLHHRPEGGDSLLETRGGLH
jgi:hypothetical protein